jgi:hypothetical protein
MGVERDYEKRRAKQQAHNEQTDSRALLPVRDGPKDAWKRRQKSKKAAAQQPAAAPAPKEEPGPVDDKPELSFAQKKVAIAKMASQLLEAPHKHVTLLRQLHEYATRDPSPAVRLRPHSAAA